MSVARVLKKCRPSKKRASTLCGRAQWASAMSWRRLVGRRTHPPTDKGDYKNKDARVEEMEGVEMGLERREGKGSKAASRVGVVAPN